MAEREAKFLEMPLFEVEQRRGIDIALGEGLDVLRQVQTFEKLRKFNHQVLPRSGAAVLTKSQPLDDLIRTLPDHDVGEANKLHSTASGKDMSPKRRHPRVQAGSCALCCGMGDGSGHSSRGLWQAGSTKVCFGSFMPF